MDNEYNESLFNSKKYIFKQNGGEQLLIILNTHNQGERYFGLSTLFSCCSEVDLLFIVDPNNSYYLEDDNGTEYLDLIESISKRYDINKVSIFGTSMAGFAALHFGFKMSCNIISINPQIDLDRAKELAWPDLKKTINNIRSDINLSKISKKHYKGSPIFAVFGRHRLDEQAFKEFMSLELINLNVNITRVENEEHKFFLTDLAELEKIHFLCCEMRRINTSVH